MILDLLLWDIPFLILSLVVAGIFIFIQKLFALRSITGYVLTSLVNAIIFAVIGFFCAKMLLDEHFSFPDTATLTFIYTIVGLGILYGAGLGIPLYKYIRKFAYPDPKEFRPDAIIALLLLSIFISLGLCSITTYFMIWTGE